MKPWTLKDWLAVLQPVSIIVGLFFVGFQIYNQTQTLELQTKALQDNQKINSATFVLKLSDELDKTKYDKIMIAIDNNTKDYDIFKHKITGKLLEDYIGDFETLGNFVRDKLISEDMAYNELGYEIEKAWRNQSVRKYIEDMRKADKNETGANAFYTDFQKLAERFLIRDKKECSTLN